MYIRRRKQYVINTFIFIFLCVLFIKLKPLLLNNSPSTTIITNIIIKQNILYNETSLTCSGDPAKTWCEKEMKLCDSSVIIYNNLFAVTRSVILQPKYAIGKRLGGENLQDVLNQPEHNEYFNFEKEFIKVPCDVQLSDGEFSTSHLSNIFSTITSYKTKQIVHMVNETTIAVNRHDYVNIYHTITDLYTVYALCRFFRRDPKSVRILFLDAHPKGNLDLLWSQLFHSYSRLGLLKNYSSIFYQELIWSQPQSQSEIDIDKRRRKAPSFFAEFRRHVLDQFNINYSSNKNVDCQSLNIFFLVRHNYVAHPRNPSGKITRQLPKEKEVLDDLKLKFSKFRNINFSVNHFEELSIEEQLKTIINTDVFVGVHGAGLTHVLFLQPGRILIELASPTLVSQKHFESIAAMNDVNYYRCGISDALPDIAQTIFDCIKQKIVEKCNLDVDSTRSKDTFTWFTTTTEKSKVF